MVKLLNNLCKNFHVKDFLFLCTESCAYDNNNSNNNNDNNTSKNNTSKPT